MLLWFIIAPCALQCMGALKYGIVFDYEQYVGVKARKLGDHSISMMGGAYFWRRTAVRF